MPAQLWQWKLDWKVLVGLLVLLAGAEFLYRGPLRLARNSDFNDFISPYIQTRAWLGGVDPYSPANLVHLWPTGAQRFDFLSKDLASGTLVINRGIPTAYPPTAFVLLTPVAVLPWPVAHYLWLAILLASYFVAVLSVRALADLPWGEPRTYLYFALALALAPFHTAFAAGSIVVVAVAGCVCAISAAERQQIVLAGVLLAIAIGLKPQIGLPFLLYYLLRRRWRIAAIACATLAAFLAVAVARLAANAAPWVSNYLYDNRILFASGSLGDFTEHGPLRFGLINLQVVIYALLGNRDLANLLALAIAGILGLAWLYLLFRRPNQLSALLHLSTIAVLSLLPVYHRLYDASLLILPLAWCLTALAGRSARLAKIALVLIAVFLVPGGSALQSLQQGGHFATLQHTWWWNAIVMPHQVWTLFLLGLILLQAMRADGDPTLSSRT
jgi:glycosyl transferase family 87